MKIDPWQWLKSFPGLLASPRPEPERQAGRIVAVQRRFVLPVRVGVLAVALYYMLSLNVPPSTETVVLQTLRGFLSAYIFCNTVAAVFFFAWKRFPPEIFQWLAFVLGLLDGLFVAGIVMITDGSASIAFWIFPILIVLNAISIPLAMPQIVLNLLLTAFYVGASLLYADIVEAGKSEITLMYVPGHGPTHVVIETNMVTGQVRAQTAERTHKPFHWDGTISAQSEEAPTGSFLSNVFVLLLLTLCCYGVQSLAERQRRELEEAREFAVRESQLHSAGRLAAEFAHQIKNPLAVIASAAYSLQRSVAENKNSAAQQIEIIQEEVARADRVVTQIMGYAQLSEGRVEKLDVIPELERAVGQVFPPAVPSNIKIRRQYAQYFPPLMMQRGHLSDILVNLLSNAREALGTSGNIFIKASCHPDYTVEVSIRDDGPGVPPDKLTRIFEAYYTTKTKGSGLGLAIVRHNVDLYGGSVRVKSEVGKGAEFILSFPAKAIMHITK